MGPGEEKRVREPSRVVRVLKVVNVVAFVLAMVYPIRVIIMFIGVHTEGWNWIPEWVYFEWPDFFGVGPALRSFFVESALFLIGVFATWPKNRPWPVYRSRALYLLAIPALGMIFVLGTLISLRLAH